MCITCTFFSGRVFVRELDKILDIADEAERSRKLKLFQEWNAAVHGVIQVIVVTDLLR